MSTPGPDEARRLGRAIDAIDAANRDDPNRLEVRGVERPKELAHAELVTEWVRRLAPDASDVLLLAARAHHVRRWELPRDRYPRDRGGYLRWRKELQQLHADVTGRILGEAGYDTERIERVQDIVRKRGLGRDPEVQVFEDALCLTFLETQLETFTREQPASKAATVLAKTLGKMSPEARRLSRGLAPAGPAATVLERALDETADG